MEKYNYWTVLEILEKEKYRERYAICKCLCGTVKTQIYRMVINGKTKSCGCLRKGFGKPVITNQMVVNKYNELKRLKDTARYFKKGDTFISNILKEEGVDMYLSLRKDKEYVRKKRVKKVMDYKKRRLLKDPHYKSILRMRSLISQVFIKKKYTKKSVCCEILGIGWEGLKVYIENKFVDGMTWDNYGLWEYDHIIPISSAKNEEELIKLNHYTNFQPLWKEDNRSKSNKFSPKHDPLFLK